MRPRQHAASSRPTEKRLPGERAPRTLVLATFTLIVVAFSTDCGGSGHDDSGRGPDLPRTEVARSLTVRVTGKDYRWHFRYPGPDGTLDTADDVVTRKNLVLPVGTSTTLLLHSGDYLYTLALPRWALKEIAVPDMVFTLQFETDAVGTYELLGDQFCGYAHQDLMGKLIVQTHEDFQASVDEAANQVVVTE